MRKLILASLFFCLLPIGLRAQSGGSPSSEIPHLEQRGQTTQLIVDGKPFLMLAGELHNSSSSSLEYMKPSWPALAAMGLNTVVTPLSWELIEPTEGHYDFVLLDGLLAQARSQHLRIVFLWLAAWKNGMSSYPPVWVKQDTKRFPRVVQNGNAIEVLSTQAPATADADGRALAAVMAHIKEVDAQDHTVLMMQIENEVGILGSSRDHSAAAERGFAQPVPQELMRSLASHHNSLNPELRALWEQNGAKTSGTWTEIFGDSARTDEIFMAWNYAHYLQGVSAKGKAAYALPTYVNAWLGGDYQTPGTYPSGGPQPRVIDVWKAAGTSIDLYCPDLYSPDFYGWSERYHRPDNPLFMPETNGGSLGAANVFYAVGEHAALGFSPFAIDAGMHGAVDGLPNAEAAAKGRADLSSSYKLLGLLIPKILAAQASGNIHGFVLDKGRPSLDFVMHGMTVHVTLDEIFGNHAENGYGLIIEESPNTFLGVGKGFRVSFAPRDPASPRVGLASVDEGTFQDGQWIAGRRLNGDENDQGNYWRFDPREAKIERATIYEVH